MKNLIKKLLREHILSEKLAAVDDDVNFLYDKFFKHIIDEIEGTGMITVDMLNSSETDTSVLKSKDSVMANELNPCKIIINKEAELFNLSQNLRFKGNYYNINNRIISIGLSPHAVSFAMDNGGDIKKSIEYLKKFNGEKIANSFKNEFTEARVKGSIHHELAHWLDDTLNNKHMLRTLKTIHDKKMPVNKTKLEIQGIIHNVKQLHNKYFDKWDTMTFDDLLTLSPPMTNVNDTLKGEDKKEWLRSLKTRMNREGLLGKNMK